MNLYEITNGWMDYGHIHVLVMAENEARARILAKSTLEQKDASKSGLNLTVKFLWSDEKNTEWCSEIRD